MKESMFKMLSSNYTDEEIANIADALYVSDIKEFEQKNKAIAYLYLKMSVILDIPISEVFKRYGWQEKEKDADYVMKNGMLQVASLRETTIYLVPRELPIENSIELSKMLLELVRESFYLPKDGDII